MSGTLRYHRAATAALKGIDMSMWLSDKGQGRFCSPEKKQPMEYLDTAYISPDTPISSRTLIMNPLASSASSNAKRDRPKLLK